MEKKGPSNNPLEPFIGVFSGIKDIVTAFGGVRPPAKQNTKKRLTGGKSDVDLVLEMEDAKAELKRSIYQTYKNYKKLHALLTW